MTPFFTSTHSLFNVLLIFLLTTIVTPTTQAQPPPPSENPNDLITLPTGKVFRWWGYAGRTYFVQISDANNPLGKWNWVPIIEAGDDAEISYEVDGTAPNNFFRLKPTDLPIPVGKTLDTADFDSDGISNIDEIKPPLPLLASDATDPLDADTDHDGLPDGYERSHGFDPNDDATTNPNNGPTGDPDGDGLTNAQELARGTAPNNRDSDGDGVSDWDEVMVNSTNPLTSTDGDGDGIPDDFEKHFAKQLLEFQPDPTAWGTYFAGLLAENLDASHDYTGDGVSTAELSSLFTQSASGFGNPQAEYLIEPQYRFNKLMNGYSLPSAGTSPPVSYGQYVEGGFSGTGEITLVTELSLLTDLNPAYLEDHIGGVSWLPQVSNGFAEWSSFSQSYYSHSVAGFQTTQEHYYTRYSGFDKQCRLRLVATRLNHEPFNQQVIKLTSKKLVYSSDGHDLGESISAEPLTITIPKGRFLTGWINLEPPVIEGRATVVSLQTVNIIDVKDHSNEGDDVVISNWTSGQKPTDANVAWIEAHKSATDDAPRMPQLVFNVPSLPQFATLEAKLLVEYERPYAGKQADDTVLVPTNGAFQSVTHGRWEIWSEYTNIPFFGGDAFMNDSTLRNGPGSMPNGQRPQTTFHTGHNVPVPSRAQGPVTFGDNHGEKKPEDAVAIKLYNGASANWCSWRGPTAFEWQFNYGQNNYVEEVCNEIEEVQP